MNVGEYPHIVYDGPTVFETLYDFLIMYKYRAIYTRPKYFQDLHSLPFQTSNWEFTVLYIGEFGLRVIINLSTVAYLGIAWNSNIDRNLLLIQL